MVSLVHAGENVNGTHMIKSQASEKYSGIVNSEFAQESEISPVIEKLITLVGTGRLGTLTVGVPSCFCTFHVNHARREFPKPKRITRKMANEMLNGGSAVYYKVDGGSPVLDAVGQVASRIEVQVSHLEISAHFLNAIEACRAIDRNFSRLDFVPVVQAEANYLIDTHVRDKTCVLVSCKLTDTSVAVVVGDQIVAIETFDMGVAHVINEISLDKGVDYYKAVEMFERYDKFDVDKIGGIVKARLEDMAEQVNTIITRLDHGLLGRPVYVCGGYTDNIFGAFPEYLKTMCPLNEVNPPDIVSRDAVIFQSLL